MEAKINWINIKDAVPSKPGLVITCLKNKVDAPKEMERDIYISYYRSDRGFEVWGSARPPINDMPVEYWSELPETPKE